MLYEKGYSKKEVLNLFRFIDWVLILPEELEELFHDELTEYEKEKNMPYITSIERIGEKRGILLGEKRGILLGEKRGAKLTTKEIAIKMLKKGYDLNAIIDLTSLSAKEINELKEQNTWSLVFGK